MFYARGPREERKKIVSLRISRRSQKNNNNIGSYETSEFNESVTKIEMNKRKQKVKGRKKKRKRTEYELIMNLHY